MSLVTITVAIQLIIMDGYTTLVRIQERISTCIDWILGCFGRRTKWRNNKVACAKENDGDVKKELRDLAEEMQNRLSKLETSRQLLWIKWKEAEYEVEIKPSKQNKIDKLFEEFMNMKRQAEALKIQLEELKHLSHVTSVSIDEEPAAADESCSKPRETVKEKKTVRFSEQVEVAYTAFYDRRIDKSWTRLSYRQKLSIHRELYRFKRYEMKVYPGN